MKDRTKGKNLDVTLLRTLLDYNPETGSLHWKARPDSMFTSQKQAAAWNKRYSGQRALWYIHNGYYSGSLLGSPMEAHRVAWALHYGSWPKHHIDHINGIRHDNRIENLRDVPAGDNLRNQRLAKNNTSGVLGVCWQKSANKWKASIRHEGSYKYLGLFHDFDDAVSARKAAELAMGFHENHGRTEVDQEKRGKSTRERRTNSMLADNAALITNDGKLPLSSDIAGKNGTKYRHVADSGENPNAQIIAELTHARCVFQLATICAIMGISPPPLTALVCAEGEKS